MEPSPTLLDHICQVLQYIFSKEFTNSKIFSYEELIKAIKYIFRIKCSICEDNKSKIQNIISILISDEFKGNFLKGIRIMSNEIKLNTFNESCINQVIKSCFCSKGSLNVLKGLNVSRFIFYQKPSNRKFLLESIFPLKSIPNSKTNFIPHKLSSNLSVNNINQIIDGTHLCFYIFLTNNEVKVIYKEKMIIIEEFTNINFLQTLNENKALMMIDETFTQLIIRTDKNINFNYISIPFFEILTMCNYTSKQKEYILILTKKNDILSLEFINEDTQTKFIAVFNLLVQCQENIKGISLGELLAIQFQDRVDLFIFPENIFVFQINLAYKFDGNMIWSRDDKLLVSGEIPFVFHINKKSNYTSGFKMDFFHNQVSLENSFSGCTSIGWSIKGVFAYVVMFFIQTQINKGFFRLYCYKSTLNVSSKNIPLRAIGNISNLNKEKLCKFYTIISHPNIEEVILMLNAENGLSIIRLDYLEIIYTYSAGINNPGQLKFHIFGYYNSINSMRLIYQNNAANLECVNFNMGGILNIKTEPLKKKKTLQINFIKSMPILTSSNEKNDLDNLPVLSHEYTLKQEDAKETKSIKEYLSEKQNKLNEEIGFNSKNNIGNEGFKNDVIKNESNPKRLIPNEFIKDSISLKKEWKLIKPEQNLYEENNHNLGSFHKKRSILKNLKRIELTKEEENKNIKNYRLESIQEEIEKINKSNSQLEDIFLSQKNFHNHLKTNVGKAIEITEKIESKNLFFNEKDYTIEEQSRIFLMDTLGMLSTNDHLHFSLPFNSFLVKETQSIFCKYCSSQIVNYFCVSNNEIFFDLNCWLKQISNSKGKIKKNYASNISRKTAFIAPIIPFCLTKYEDDLRDYFPQVGDEVYFIPYYYEKFVSENSFYFIWETFLMKLWKQKSIIPEILCTIEAIEYCFPFEYSMKMAYLNNINIYKFPIIVKLTLKIQKQDQKLNILFLNVPHSKFLILKYIYEEQFSLFLNFFNERSKLKEHQLLSIYSENIEIQKIIVIDEMIWIESKDSRKYMFWEIRYNNLPYCLNLLNNQNLLKIVNLKLNLNQNDEDLDKDFEIELPTVNFLNLRLCNEKFPFFIDIYKIIDLLEKNYYRTISHLIQNLTYCYELFKYFFKSKYDPICKNTKKVCKIIIRRFQNISEIQELYKNIFDQFKIKSANKTKSMKRKRCL